MSTLGLRTSKAGRVCFVLAPGAGSFVITVRVPFLVPRLGERVVELVEMPFMVVFNVVAARHITKRFALPATIPVCLTTGSLALGLLIAAEPLLAVAVQDRSLGEDVAGPDPVSVSASRFP